MSFFRYMKNLVVFGALLSLVAGILSFTLPEKYFVPQMWMILIYFMVISALFYLVLLSKEKGEPKKYIRTFLAGTTARLFIHIGALIAFALLNREKAIPLIITFFCCYLLFTVFEVTMQLKKPRQDGPAEKPAKT
jgi:F0F1-type ATP synthase assembly protein I